MIDFDNRKTVSYSKYLMEQYLGRELLPDETVDHISRDFTDDRIENLQILTRLKHTKLDAKYVKKITLKCIWCGNSITRIPSKFNNRNHRIAGPFCSKSCSGKYEVELQNNRMKRLEYVEVPIAEYFQKEK